MREPAFWPRTIKILREFVDKTVRGALPERQVDFFQVVDSIEDNECDAFSMRLGVQAEHSAFCLVLADRRSGGALAVLERGTII